MRYGTNLLIILHSIASQSSSAILSASKNCTFGFNEKGSTTRCEFISRHLMDENLLIKNLINANVLFFDVIKSEIILKHKPKKKQT